VNQGNIGEIAGRTESISGHTEAPTQKVADNCPSGSRCPHRASRPYGVPIHLARAGDALARRRDRDAQWVW
jgi:hypothetical protein